MKEITLDCEFITTGQIHGANTNVIEKIRVQSIKGLMRFWWRYINYKIVGEPKIENLRNNENTIFGGKVIDKDSNNKEQLKKSPIRIFIKESNGITKGGKDTFTLIFQYNEKNKNINIEIIKEYINSIIYLQMFGGIGKGGRKGNGNFIIKNIDFEDKVLEEDLKIKIMPLYKDNKENMKAEYEKFYKKFIENKYIKMHKNPFISDKYTSVACALTQARKEYKNIENRHGEVPWIIKILKCGEGNYAYLIFNLLDNKQ